MKFLNSRSGAIMVTALVVIVCILFGSHRSLTAERDKVENLFHSGADGSGKSVSTDVSACMDVAANLLTVGARYLPETELAKLEGSRNMLADWHGVANAHTAYERMLTAADEVLTKLEGAGLTGKDAQYVSGFRADLTAKADTIARDPYNQRVDEFNDSVLGKFPANVLSRITSVSPAEAFR